MGYYTEYTLTVRNVANHDRYDALVSELTKYDLFGYAFSKGTFLEKEHEAVFPCYDSAKWYEHESNMIHIAEALPEMYFKLECCGEEFNDFWREYYHDMDHEHCCGDVVFEKPNKIQWAELALF